MRPPRTQRVRRTCNRLPAGLTGHESGYLTRHHALGCGVDSPVGGVPVNAVPCRVPGRSLGRAASSPRPPGFAGRPGRRLGRPRSAVRRRSTVPAAAGGGAGVDGRLDRGPSGRDQLHGVGHPGRCTRPCSARSTATVEPGASSCTARSSTQLSCTPPRPTWPVAGSKPRSASTDTDGWIPPRSPPPLAGPGWRRQRCRRPTTRSARPSRSPRSQRRSVRCRSSSMPRRPSATPGCRPAGRCLPRTRGPGVARRASVSSRCAPARGGTRPYPPDDRGRIPAPRTSPRQSPPPPRCARFCARASPMPRAWPR